MNKTTNKTQITWNTPVCPLADQVPYMPEPQLWKDVFTKLEKKYWKIHTSHRFSMDARDTARNSFRALGLSCKALYEIYLPQEKSLSNREMEHSIAIRNSNATLMGWMPGF